MSEVEKPEAESPEPLSFTLPRAQWNMILFLAIRGAREVTDQFVEGKAHSLNCVSDAVSAVRALQDIYKERVLLDAWEPSGKTS
jgi:hypothetical protein